MPWKSLKEWAEEQRRYEEQMRKKEEARKRTMLKYYEPLPSKPLLPEVKRKSSSNPQKNILTKEMLADMKLTDAASAVLLAKDNIEKGDLDAVHSFIRLAHDALNEAARLLGFKPETWRGRR